MGAKEDREHFQSYRHQTLVKHTIVGKYLPAYFDILKGRQSRLLYIDAFAGAGYYRDEAGNEFPGSAINALDLLARAERLRGVVRCVFSEPDADNFGLLEEAIARFKEANPDIPDPMVHQAKFDELIDAFREVHGKRLNKMAPAFLLVDPCGIRGASMSHLAVVLATPYSEAFVFLNFSGLIRVLGAGLLSPVIELFGDEQGADEAFNAYSSLDGEEREYEILRVYMRALERLGSATHVCPFRIEYESKTMTSHYLIHATKHELGFVIMKDVMWDLGSGDGLELLQRSGRDQSQMVLLESDNDVDGEILRKLNARPRKVEYFTKVLASKPGNYVARKYYKARLLKLEDSGQVRIEQDGEPKPASKRQRRNGQPTLADHYEAHLV